MNAVGSVASTENSSRRMLAICMYVLASALVLIDAATQAPERHGDGFEYLAMIEAFYNHWTPDLRHEDLASLRSLLADSDIPVHSPIDAHFYETRGVGRMSWHFWLYPLLATPIRSGLEILGADPLAALQVLNACSFVLAVGIVLFAGRQAPRDRWLYFGLVVVGPVWWFLPWTHPEVFTWSAVVIAITLYRVGRPSWAALVAAMGAMQNPPVAFLAFWIVGLTAVEGDRRRTFKTAIAVLPAAIPILFSLWVFGTPNKIVSEGMAGWNFISWQRVHSLLFDLNQGMGPHIPWLVALWLATAIFVALRRDVRGVFIFGLLIPMLSVSVTQSNWNGGTAGIMRYAVWMAPVMAWLVVDHLPCFRGRDVVVGIAILAQLPLVLARGSEEDFLSHGPVAAWVLTHAPSFYSPVPEIFIERTLHLEANEEDLLRGHLPVVYAREDGVVTKLAYAAPPRPADFAHLAVDPSYLESLRSRSPRRDGIAYDEPPDGAVRKYEPIEDDPLRGLEDLTLRILDLPRMTDSPDLEVAVRVENGSERTFWHGASSTPTPLNVAYHVLQGEEMLLFDGRRSWLPAPLRPGTSVQTEARVDLPREPGRYSIDIDLVLEGVRWLNVGTRFDLIVERGTNHAYRAELHSGG